MKKIWFKILIIIIVILIVFFALNYINYQFTYNRWINNPDIRYRMIDDLEREHQMLGKTQKEVIEILGEPDSIGENNSENGRYVYYTYYIGVKPEFFSLLSEPDIYFISFYNDVVVMTSVQPT